MKLALRVKQAGQGMTEYIIIVALIGVAAIATYQYFGTTVRNQTAAIAMEISGQSGTPQVTASQTAATSGSTEANTNHTLNNYVDNINK